jgi:demethylmenaquinone methyltransferase/2-methoxy-6-polyprenyl-1,4-benzoquinol methylase
MTDSALSEQLEYYSARAAEYDQWWLRLGRYDHGETLNAQWFAEAQTVRSALKTFRPSGRILELACGTGIWTEQLVPWASALTAVDGSPEMLRLNAARLQSSRVEYVQADLFTWKPAATFDVVFFSFWLSHVPAERFDDFSNLVRSCLTPSGRVFFIDSRRDPTSTAVDHRLPGPETAIAHRRLNDGREFRVYKIFYDPLPLTEQLRTLGWKFEIQVTPNYFIYGTGTMI